MDWKKLKRLTRTTLANPNFQSFCELGKSLEYSLKPSSENLNFESKDKPKNAMSQFEFYC